MYVLGIETSCDETSAAVVKDGRELLSNVTASSLRFHQKYGGVIPEIAFRKQLETISQVTDEAVSEAGISRGDIGLVCVTAHPGLLGSLVVGVSFAKSVSLALGVPLLGVNHIHSHIYAGSLEVKGLRPPFIGLIVSGGHTSIFQVRDFRRITLLGSTQDDACGEAFDKVAKILGLGYPGGPAIEKAAMRGDPSRFKFACSGTRKPLDFSYSGIKTAVLYLVQKLTRSGKVPLLARDVADISAGFQEAALGVLAHKAGLACLRARSRTLVVGGGVAANSRLRAMMEEAGKAGGFTVHFPSKPLCMDNAAMVAGFGYQQYKLGMRSDMYLKAG